jgi:hypothetical protein
MHTNASFEFVKMLYNHKKAYSHKKCKSCDARSAANNISTIFYFSLKENLIKS